MLTLALGLAASVQALVARRQEHFDYRAETRLEFSPDTYQQAAGLTTYYNRFKFFAVVVTYDPSVGRCLQLMSCHGTYPSGGLEPMPDPQPIYEGAVDLAVEVRSDKQRFFWRQNGAWTAFGPELNATLISDEAPPGEHQSFTGAFVGMVAFDVSGQGREARFLRFSYDPQA